MATGGRGSLLGATKQIPWLKNVAQRRRRQQRRRYSTCQLISFVLQISRRLLIAVVVATATRAINGDSTCAPLIIVVGRRQRWSWKLEAGSWKLEFQWAQVAQVQPNYRAHLRATGGATSISRRLPFASFGQILLTHSRAPTLLSFRPFRPWN